MTTQKERTTRTVGILGAGQLGCLIGKALQKLGCVPLFFDENPEAPGLHQFPGGFCGRWNDTQALQAFLEHCDALTFEFENVDLKSIEAMARERGLPAFPDFHVVRTAQDRRLEKDFLSRNGFPLGAWATGAEWETIAQEIGFPLILKTATLGYDGKGQWRVEGPQELQALLSKNPVPLTAEEPIALAAEASVIVCRSAAGEAKAFPLFENEHRNHILAFTTQPARFPPMVCSALQEIALGIATALNAVGLLTVEFFLSRQPGRHGAGLEIDGWYLFVNELAPRPHNSGHITLASCNQSQFDALARVLAGVPLPPLRLRPGGWCMGNLLGELWPSATDALPLQNLTGFPEISDVVLYGKSEARAGRKMGHFVAEAHNEQEARRTAEEFVKSLEASSLGNAYGR